MHWPKHRVELSFPQGSSRPPVRFHHHVKTANNQMRATAHPRDGFRNRILKRLPTAVIRRLRKGMRLVELTQWDALYEPHERCKYVYFPETGMASILSVLKDGTMTEVSTVGNEGMVGLPVFFGAKTSARRAFWQVQGSAYRMDAAVLRRETRKCGALSEALLRYTQALFTQVSQLATCNRLHSIEQRCCCWLLLTHDRVAGDEFDLTHEFLSEMLGTRRAGVTEVAATLQRAGLIRYTRGRVTILNRRGLEKMACECYATVRREFDRLLGT